MEIAIQRPRCRQWQRVETMSNWKQIVPSASGGRPEGKQSPTARLGENGHLSLNSATVKLLGATEKALIFVDTATHEIKLEPATLTDKGGWTLTGGGNTTHRVTLKQLVASHPSMVGEYRVTKQARSIVLVKTEQS